MDNPAMLALALFWLLLSANDWLAAGEESPCAFRVAALACAPNGAHTGMCHLERQQWWWRCVPDSPPQLRRHQLPEGHPPVLIHAPPCASSFAANEVSLFSSKAWAAWLLGICIVAVMRLFDRAQQPTRPTAGLGGQLKPGARVVIDGQELEVPGPPPGPPPWETCPHTGSTVCTGENVIEPG